ncbi:hypothetical protein ABKN59_010672 [Abortiporus biennis]
MRCINKNEVSLFAKCGSRHFPWRLDREHSRSHRTLSPTFKISHAPLRSAMHPYLTRSRHFGVISNQSSPSSDTDDYEVRDHESYSSDESEDYYEEPLPSPLSISFEVGETVWVKPSTIWYQGRVVKVTKVPCHSAMSMMSSLYAVRFRKNLKGWFSPRDGNIQRGSTPTKWLLRSGKVYCNEPSSSTSPSDQR